MSSNDEEKPPEEAEAPLEEEEEKPIVEIVEEPLEEKEEELLEEEPVEEIVEAPPEEIVIGPVMAEEPITPTGFSFVGFCHGYFSWLGRPLLRLYRGVSEDLRIAQINLHPEAYTSLVAFLIIISIIISISGIPFIFIKM